MITNERSMLLNIRKNSQAIIQANFWDLNSIRAITDILAQSKTPMIMALNENDLDYLSFEEAVMLVKFYISKSQKTIALHFDGENKFENISKAIHAGFTSVKVNNKNSFEETVKNTKEIVKIAHENGVTVEGKINGNQLTDPNEAKYFVNKTGVDSLAINIGKKHGDNEFYLDLVRLAEIAYIIDVPLAMDCTNFSMSMIKQCVNVGISKVKISTDLMFKREIVITQISKDSLKNAQNQNEEKVKDKLLEYFNVCSG